MLFNFSLVPLPDIRPWGEPGDHHLSWFGMTDAQYWIEAGDNVLLQYSDEVRLKPGATKYCDYQVARLHEDLMAMVPFVLEPVPASLIPYVAGDRRVDWWERRARWLKKCFDQLGDDRCHEVADASIGWLGSRTLDSLHLRPSANIRIWSDETTVYLDWDNRDQLIEGVHAWSALHGRYRISRDQFVIEVRSFHERLMAQMTERVEQVVAGALPAQIRVDLHGLRREQAKRCSLVDSAFEALTPPSDWRRVQDALRQIEQG